MLPLLYPKFHQRHPYITSSTIITFSSTATNATLSYLYSKYNHYHDSNYDHHHYHNVHLHCTYFTSTPAIWTTITSVF